MASSIARWGNSLAIRLPKTALDATDFREGDPVTITAQGDTLVVRRAPRVDIDAMIASISPEHLPDESFDWAPVGNEIL